MWVVWVKAEILEKMMNAEYLNNLKKADQERREAILKNHKQSKSPSVKQPKISTKVGLYL